MKQSIQHILFASLCCISMVLQAQEEPEVPEAPEPKSKEQDYYTIQTIPLPEGMLAEVGGMTTLPDGRVAFCTRRGDVWLMENPTMIGNTNPRFSLYATGLHEPLGLAYRDHSIYATQRSEVTRLTDTDGDDVADKYETVYAWQLSGNYHEYSYGPKFAPDGSMFVTGNVAFGDAEWWRGESRFPGRGWAMHIFPDGKMELWAAGMRSPCGLGMFDGEFFYTDNQGDFVGTGGVWHVKKGGFMGHPASLNWAGKPGSPVKISRQDFAAKVKDKREFKDGKYLKPENDEKETNPQLLTDVKKDFPQLQLPAVKLPHAILGISNSEILEDRTGGKFGPFAGQLFVGDQGQSKIMRVVLEKVKGEYQGVAFDFAGGFQSGVLRMTFGDDGSMFVGETNRGWGSAGNSTNGVERLVWTGVMPMEMKTVHAMPDGFEIEFTKPVDRKLAADPSRYSGRSFTYKYHSTYGSPLVNDTALKVRGVQVAEDGLKVRVVVDNLRQYYIHELIITGMRGADKTELVHPSFYYTLNNIPDGEKLPDAKIIRKKPETKKKAKEVVSKAGAGKSGVKVPTAAQIKILLDKNTCSACHQADKRQVGPAFRDIARKGYSNQRIVELIYKPQAGNWPDYATEMPPMPQVDREEALKIAAWINSLK